MPSYWWKEMKGKFIVFDMEVFFIFVKLSKPKINCRKPCFVDYIQNILNLNTE